MSEPLRLVPPRVALTDPRTGMVTREWYIFLQGLYNRGGGATGESTTDIVASLFEDAGSSETNAMLFSVEQASSQAPSPVPLDYVADLPPALQQAVQLDNVVAELSALRDRVSELVKELDSIKQGILI